MARTASLDTNLIVTLFVRRENIELSEAIVRTIEANQVTHLADLAVVETVFVLNRYYKLDRMTIASLFDSFFENPKIECNVTLFKSALSYYVQKPALSFEDCCLAVYAELNNALPLLTNDHKLARQLPQAELIKV